MVQQDVPPQVVLAGEALGAVDAGVGALARVALQVLAQVVLAQEAHGAVSATERPVRRVLAHVALQVVLVGEADGAVVALEREGGGAPGGHVQVESQPRKNGVRARHAPSVRDHMDVELSKDWREVFVEAACQAVPICVWPKHTMQPLLPARRNE